MHETPVLALFKTWKLGFGLMRLLQMLKHTKVREGIWFAQWKKGSKKISGQKSLHGDGVASSRTDKLLRLWEQSY